MPSKKILALSSSRSGDSGYLETALPIIREFLGENKLKIAFIPFAFVDSYEDYFSRVKEALKSLGHQINVVLPEIAKKVIEESDCLMVGGGNTFKLLHDLYQLNLIDVIRNKIDNGTPYIGWSAGANILGPTISTTNDMPVIEPKSFNALGLFPFQINPHYFNQKQEGFNGETRDQRIEEFLKMNPGIPVIGLPEGTFLILKNEVVRFEGKIAAALFQSEKKVDGNFKNEVLPGAALSFLL
ncbi:MAG: dipeptidase PepE [Ginsengibacter sp.]